MFEDKLTDQRLFYKAIRSNQEHWKNQPRGRLSRPWEIPWVAKLVNTKIQQAFVGYIDQDKPPVKIGWSVLVDQPLTSPQFIHLDREADGVTKENQECFRLGITGINDWMTNYATRFVYSRLGPTGVGGLYGRLNDLTNRLEYNDTYALMGQIRKDSRVDALSFRDAIFSSLFKHDSTRIDQVVLGAKLPGVKTIEELAVHIGKSRHYDRARVALFDQLATPKQEESANQRLLRRTLFSLGIVGAYSTPGVVEVTLASTAGLLSLSLPMMATSSNKALVLGLCTLASGTLFSMTPFSAVHEAIHYYSASPSYVGLIPTILRKVVG